MDTQTESDDSRSDLVEAQMIVKGLTGLRATRAHLLALHEHHEVQLIRIANQLDTLKQLVLSME